MPSVIGNGRIFGETRTFTMYPQEAASRIPILEGGTSGKPHGGSIAIISSRNNLILGWVRGGKPFSRFPL